MTAEIDIPRDVRRRLPEDLPPEVVTACLSLTGGLSEAHVVATDDRLIGFVKRSALDGLELVELDRDRPPPVEVVSWQPSLVLEAADGTRVPVPLPTMDKARTRAGIAALYAAIGAWQAQYDLYAEALAETRGRSDRIALELKLASIALRIDPPTAVPHFAAVVAQDARQVPARAGLESLYGQGVIAAREALSTACAAHGDWQRVVDLARDAAEQPPDDGRVDRWLAVADLARRRLDEPDVTIDAFGRALALQYDEAVLDQLDREVRSTARWAAGAMAYAAATTGVDAPVSELWRRVATIRAERLDDAEGAAVAWAQVHAADPEALDALKALANTHRAAEQWGPFLYTSRRALQLTDDLADRIVLLRSIAEVEEHPCDRQDAAIEAWEQLVEVAAYDRTALDALERLYGTTERWQDLDGLLEKRQRVAEAALDDDTVLALLRRRARMRDEKLEDLSGAIELWRAVQGRLPDDAEAFAAIDDLMTRGEQWANLVLLLGDRTESLPPGPERGGLHRRRAVLLTERLDLKRQAVDAWRLVCIDLPRDRDAHGRIVSLLAELDRHEELIDALLAFEALLSHDDPDWLPTVVVRAEVEQRLDRHTDAVETWEMVRTFEPDHPGALAALIALYPPQGRAVDTVPLLLRRAEVGDDPAADLWAAADVLSGAGERERAAELHQRLLELDPGDARAAQALRAFYLDEGRYDELVELLDLLAEGVEPADRIELDLQRAELRFEHLGQARHAGLVLCDVAEAGWGQRRFVDLAVRCLEGGAEVYVLLNRGAARGFDEPGVRKGVLDIAARLLPGMRGDAEAARKLGAWFAVGNEHGRALECYNAALAVDPHDRDALQLKRIALKSEKRWRLLVNHLEAMTRAPLRRTEKRDALLEMAHVLQRHINAPDEAAIAKRRADALMSGGGARKVAFVIAFGVLATVVASIAYVLGQTS